MSINKSVTKPVLRYYGGKWRLAPWIISLMPEHKRYVEPFCGSCSVLMRKPAVKVEIISDTNDRIVNVFRVLRSTEQSQELKRLLALTPYSRTEYYACREPSSDPVEDARRMFVTAFQAFGSVGALRISPPGWNLDIGKISCADDRPPNFPDFSPYIDQWSARMRHVRIDNRPAREVIKQTDNPETLFYIDPPYVMATRKEKTKIYSHELTDTDHKELADLLHKVKGKVMISGYAGSLYDELYGDWRVETRDNRNIANQKTTEVLWLSPNIR